MTNQAALGTTGTLPDSVASHRRPRWLRIGLKVVGYGVGVFCLAFVALVYAIIIRFGGPYLSPAVTFGIAAGVGFLIVALGLLRRKNSLVRLIAFVAVYSLFLGSLINLNISKLNRFQAAYRSIRVGMSLDEVRSVVDTHFPDQKPMIQDYPDGCFLGPLDPNDGSFNAELFSVSFKDGLVVDKQYLPD